MSAAAPSGALAAWLACAASAGAAALLARAALGVRWGQRWGLRWVDRRDAASALRKPRTRPVPLVGGAALLVGLAVHDVVAGGAALPWPALLAAFAVGLVDDVRAGGLRPGAKLAGQLAVGLALALEPSLEPRERWLYALGAVVAQNAWNTWDHADGNAVALGLLALWPQAGVRGALAGFLPFNLLPRDRRSVGVERVPRAYLGDAGSHLLGVLVLWFPAARPALLLPLVDLARVVLLRLASGAPPWSGDRRHIGHRLAARGLSPAASAACLVLAASPPFALRALAARASLPPWAEPAAWGLALLAFGCLVAGTRDPGPGAPPTTPGKAPPEDDPCRPPGRAR